MSLLFTVSSLNWVLWYHLCWSLTSRPSLLQSKPHIPATVVISHPLCKHLTDYTHSIYNPSSWPWQSGSFTVWAPSALPTLLPSPNLPPKLHLQCKKKCLMCWDYSRSNRGNRQNQQAIIVMSGYGNGEWWEQDLQISIPPQDLYKSSSTQPRFMSDSLVSLLHLICSFITQYTAFYSVCLFHSRA